MTYLEAKTAAEEVCGDTSWIVALFPRDGSWVAKLARYPHAIDRGNLITATIGGSAKARELLDRLTAEDRKPVEERKLVFTREITVGDLPTTVLT